MLKLANAARNDVNQNIRVFNDLIGLSKILFSHVGKKLVEFGNMEYFPRIGKQ